jgi:hypothetical protein
MAARTTTKMIMTTNAAIKYMSVDDVPLGCVVGEGDGAAFTESIVAADELP